MGGVGGVFTCVCVCWGQTDVGCVSASSAGPPHPPMHAAATVTEKFIISEIGYVPCLTMLTGLDEQRIRFPLKLSACDFNLPAVLAHIGRGIAEGLGAKKSGTERLSQKQSRSS